jgi:hypothetical protein
VRSCKLNIKKWCFIRFDGLSKEGDCERMDLGVLCLGQFSDFGGFKTREDESTIGKVVYITVVLCFVSVVLPSNS